MPRFACYYSIGFAAAAVFVFAQRSGSRTAGVARGRSAPRMPGALAGKRAADRVPKYREGVELLAAERFSAALEALTRAARLAPDDPRPQYRIGLAYRGLQLTELEERAYRRALEIDPSHHLAKVSLSRLLCDSGRNDEAVTLLQAAREEKPDDSLVWAELALNYRRMGKTREAVRLLKKYNAAAGRQDWGYANLGRALAARGDHEAAEKAYREAIAINRRSDLSRLWLGQLLVSLGRKAEAEGILQEFRRLRRLETQAFQLKSALLRSPDNTKALLRLAQVRNLLGKPREALICVERLLDLEPRNVGALVSAAHALTLLNKPAKALGPLREALQIQPDNQELRTLYEKRRRAVEGARRK